MKQLLFISTFLFFIGSSFAHNWLPAGDATLEIEAQKLKIISDKKEEGANRFFDSEPGLYYKVYLDVLEENTDVIVSIISQPTTGTGAVLKKEEVKYGNAELNFQAITDKTLISVRRDNKDEDGETVFFIEHIKVTFIEEKEAEEPALEPKITHIIGEKKYELADHLGNVHVVVSDRKIPVDSDNDGTVDNLSADVVNATDYYAFGMVMPGRAFNSNTYRFGFNGKEKDDEIEANGNIYDYGFRIYNAGLGRFLSIDPLSKSYPWYTPYQFAGNTPIQAIDLDGLEIYYAQDGSLLGKYGTSTDIYVVNDDKVATTKSEFSSYNKALKDDAIATNQYLSQTLLSEGSVSFDNYFTVVADVTNDAPLQTWANNGKNCNAAAIQQLADEGITQKGPGSAIQTDVDNAQQTTSGKPNLGTANPIGGAIYIQTQLNKGNPVMVGLKETKTDNTIEIVPNYNALTGHFVVITGTTVADNGDVSFSYLDNASAVTGKSEGNKLALDKTTGSMGDDTSPSTGGVSAYGVSEVRKNN